MQLNNYNQSNRDYFKLLKISTTGILPQLQGIYKCNDEGEFLGKET